ncbi:ECF transporter S component [Calditrichota bacterium]
MRKEMNEHEIRQIPLTAILAASGIILPQFFHMLGIGSTFLPMFLPIVLGSMLLHWRFALSLAIICPLVSWLLTGMPPMLPPVLPIMLIELSAMALVISLIRVHLNKAVWIALISGILVDRILLFLIVLAVAPLLGFTHPIFSYALVFSGTPGIVLQLITIPVAMKFIEQKFPQYITEKRDNKWRENDVS